MKITTQSLSKLIILLKRYCPCLIYFRDHSSANVFLNMLAKMKWNIIITINLDVIIFIYTQIHLYELLNNFGVYIFSH